MNSSWARYWARADSRGFVAGDNFGHARFDRGKVSLGERCLAKDIVEKAGRGGRAVAELGFGKELKERGGEDVRGRVTQDGKRWCVGVLQQREFDILCERFAEVDELLGVPAVAAAGRVHCLGALRCVVLASFGEIGVKLGERLDTREEGRVRQSR